MKNEYDVLVLGAGAAGETAAQYAAQLTGLTVAIIEPALLGGACSYLACMPSKALLRPVAAARQAQRVPGVKAEVNDVETVLRHRDEVVHQRVDDSQVAWATEVGLDVLRGHGRLHAAKRVRLTQPSAAVSEITARHAIVLATGSVPHIPDIPGLIEAEPWTSDDATGMSSVPGSIVILGGGVVGCEAATWLSGLGSDVTLLEPSPQLLPKLERRASELVLQGLTESGVDVRCSAAPREITRGQVVEVDLGAGGVVWADEILVATGRRPRRHDLGLEAVGLDPERLGVDDAMRVHGAQDWLYAVGDINGGPTMLTHMGKHHGRIAGEDIARRFGRRRLDDPWSPGHPVHGPVVSQVIFTDPEVATVGMTLEEARQRGNSMAFECDPAHLAGAHLLDPAFRGWAQLVVDAASRRLLGATFVGLGASELIYAATLAITTGVDLRHLWHVVPAYPTVAEVWLRLLETARAQS